MAANLSDYAENALFGLSAGSPGVSMPATLWVQLHVGDPTETGTANIASHTARASFTRTAPSGGACSNAADCVFPSLTVGQLYTHISLWSSTSGGDCWWVGQITPQVTGNTGQALTFLAGDIDLQFQ